MNLKCFSGIIITILCASCMKGKEALTIAYAPVTFAKCASDTLNAYHYISPVDHKKPLALLIVLDSGGDGAMAVKKVGAAVMQIPCFVAGSDLVRNNYGNYEPAINMLIHEICSKNNIAEDQIYIAGFSGGARMAYEYARVNTVKGVLMCGAGPNSTERLSCPVYLIAGTTDFNFEETFVNPLGPHIFRGIRMDYFRGTHEWPPAKAIEDGLLYLMKQSIPEGDELWKKKSMLLTEKADSLIQNRDFLFALKALEKALIFNPENNQAKKQLHQLKRNRSCMAAIKKIESDIVVEQKFKETYAQATLKNDSAWWISEIDYLKQQITLAGDSNKDHFLRIKGFLGIMFYSQLNFLIHNQPENPQIPHLLVAYKNAEPDNPDVYYDYALYALIQHRPDMSRKYLNYAISKGFKDTVRLKNDFPAY